MPEGNLTPFSNQKRAEMLTDTRNKKMARSAHAYVRGNTIQFYEWLERTAQSALPEGLPI
jgi:uncharacterized protein (DUF2252 family)